MEDDGVEDDVDDDDDVLDDAEADDAVGFRDAATTPNSELASLAFPKVFNDGLAEG